MHKALTPQEMERLTFLRAKDERIKESTGAMIGLRPKEMDELIDLMKRDRMA